MYRRLAFDPLLKRLLEPRRFIQVMAGPRQVGKTTLAHQLLKVSGQAGHYISADAVLITESSWLKQQWDLARIRYKQSGAEEYILIIDEIQKIPNWSEQIKLNWDEDSMHQIPIKLVLLGSSRLLLQQGLTESLMGRFELHHIGHWSFIEMRDAFDLNYEQFAWFGGYPGAADLIQDEQRWKSYLREAIVEPTISKDILSLTRINKPVLLKQLFELGCQYSGQMLSFNKMLGTLVDAGNTTTLSHYLNLLDTAGLLAGIEKYFTKDIHRKSSSPKFQVYNNALISGQSSMLFEQATKDLALRGRYIESAIGAHLINGAKPNNYKVFYWRSENNEVDFIVEFEQKILAIEVKSSQLRSEQGMTAFIKAFNPHRSLVIHPGGISWQAFLTMNPIDLF